MQDKDNYLFFCKRNKRISFCKRGNDFAIFADKLKSGTSREEERGHGTPLRTFGEFKTIVDSILQKPTCNIFVQTILAFMCWWFLLFSLCTSAVPAMSWCFGTRVWTGNSSDPSRLSCRPVSCSMLISTWHLVHITTMLVARRSYKLSCWSSINLATSVC